MTQAAWLLPALPAVVALVVLAAARFGREATTAAALAGGAATVVVACIVLAGAAGDPAAAHESAHVWTPTGGVVLSVGTRIDGLSAVVALMVAIVSLLVTVYSTAYMAGDPRWSVYVAELSLFTAA